MQAELLSQQVNASPESALYAISTFRFLGLPRLSAHRARLHVSELLFNIEYNITKLSITMVKP